MSVTGWSRVEIKKAEELSGDAWAQGYFHSSHDHWDGKTWVRNFHELMMRDLLLLALGDVTGKKILEIGCGQGIYLDLIAKMGGEVSGQDICAEYVNKALMNLRSKEYDADIQVGDAQKLLFRDHSFDGVFTADFFEHITREEKHAVVAEVFRVLKPGGVFVIKTPNLDYLKISLMLKRLAAVLRFKSPLNIHIAHTHNNPDNQHCGLTTYGELEEILLYHFFHPPTITYIPLMRKRLPVGIRKLLYGKKTFCEQILVTTRKPLFLGFYP